MTSSNVETTRGEVPRLWGNQSKSRWLLRTLSLGRGELGELSKEPSGAAYGRHLTSADGLLKPVTFEDTLA